MNELQIFKSPEFGQIRTVMIDGKPHAVGVDVGRALEYANPSKAVIDHCKGITKLGIPSYNQHGAEVIQETNIIPEGDICRLIIKAADQSRNPEIQAKAERFESWIFDEVIPSVLRTGKYTAPKAPRIRRKPCDIVFAQRLRMADAFAKTTGIMPELAYAHALSEAEAITGEDYSSWQKLLPARSSTKEIGDLNATAVAKLVGVKNAQEANLMLEAAGLQYKTGKNWRLTEAGKQYGEEKHFDRNGHNDYHIQWRESVAAAFAEKTEGGQANA